MEKVKTSEFDELVKNNKTVVVDFFATWCGPCKMFSPILEKLSEEEKDVKVVKVDVDEEEDLAYRFGISSIPTVIIFKDGKPVSKAIGYRSLDQMKEMIK